MTQKAIAEQILERLKNEDLATAVTVGSELSSNNG